MPDNARECTESAVNARNPIDRLKWQTVRNPADCQERRSACKLAGGSTRFRRHESFFGKIRKKDEKKDFQKEHRIF